MQSNLYTSATNTTTYTYTGTDPIHTKPLAHGQHSKSHAKWAIYLESCVGSVRRFVQLRSRARRRLLLNHHQQHHT